MQLALIIISSLIFVMTVMILRNKLLRKKHFDIKFKKFNENRHNPLSKEAYRELFDLEFSPVNFMGIMMFFNIKEANHRDGDELVSNTNRDAKTRIIDHLRINQKKNNSIISLGYNFKSKENLLKFVEILSEALPADSSISFPINKEWFIFSKKDKAIGFSYKLNSVN